MAIEGFIDLLRDSQEGAKNLRKILCSSDIVQKGERENTAMFIFR